MCRAHAKLPSSYVIEGGIEREGSHACALGGAADVWKGRYYGKLVAIKSLRICRPQGEAEDDAGKGDKKVDKDMRRLMQVQLLISLLSKSGRWTNPRQKFCHEAVIWKRLSHPNLLPFLGVNKTLFRLAMVSEWMEHGTILQFVKRNVATNRLKLVCISSFRQPPLTRLTRSSTTSRPAWNISITSRLSIRTSRASVLVHSRYIMD